MGYHQKEDHTVVRQFSAGGLVFKGDQVLLIQSSRSRRAPEPLSHYWVFPKGWIDEGESSSEAALREVKEETGVEAEIITKLGNYQYFFNNSKGEKVFKTVTFYLMNYLSGDTQDHDWEVMEAKWFDLDEALETLSFPDDKKLLSEAIQIRENPTITQ